MCVADEMGVLVLVHIIMEFLVPKIVVFFKVVFHRNPCKFGHFQTVVKYFFEHYGAQISFLFIGSNLSP